jgi:hypothetical protein
MWRIQENSQFLEQFSKLVRHEYYVDCNTHTTDFVAVEVASISIGYSELR